MLSYFIKLHYIMGINFVIALSKVHTHPHIKSIFIISLNVRYIIFLSQIYCSILFFYIILFLIYHKICRFIDRFMFWFYLLLRIKDFFLIIFNFLSFLFFVVILILWFFTHIKFIFITIILIITIGLIIVEFLSIYWLNFLFFNYCNFLFFNLFLFIIYFFLWLFIFIEVRLIICTLRLDFFYRLLFIHLFLF